MPLSKDATDLFGTGAIQDPYPVYDRMRHHATVHRIGESVFYAVCGWEAVMDAVNRVEDFSSNLTATMVSRPSMSARGYPASWYAGRSGYN